MYDYAYSSKFVIEPKLSKEKLIQIWAEYLFKNKFTSYGEYYYVFEIIKRDQISDNYFEIYAETEEENSQNLIIEQNLKDLEIIKHEANSLFVQMLKNHNEKQQIELNKKNKEKQDQIKQQELAQLKTLQEKYKNQS